MRTYLSAIQVVPSQLIVITISEFVCHATTLPYHSNEALPNVFLSLDSQLGIFECDVDTALEGLIERLNAVGSEEQDALEVLQQAQEDGHESIAMYVLMLSLLQKYISL